MQVTVRVHPNSSQAKVVPESAQILSVYVRERATENKANLAVVLALAKHFQVSKSSVILVKGGRSKQKLFQILGV